MLKISNLAIYITNKCNLNCHYCYVGESKPGKTSTQVLKDTILWIKKQEFLTERIALFGGEPMIEEEMVLYFLKKMDNNFHIMIMTNGTIMSEKCAITMSSFSNYSFIISVDSIDNSMPKNLPRAMSFINKCIKYRLNYSIQLTISQKNISQISDMYKYCLSTKTVLSLRDLCNPAVFTGEDCKKIKYELIKISKSKNFNRKYIIFPGKLSTGEFNFATSCSQKILSEYKPYVISTSGNIYICEADAAFKKNRLGSIYSDEILDPTFKNELLPVYTACPYSNPTGVDSYLDIVINGIQKELLSNNSIIIYLSKKNNWPYVLNNIPDNIFYVICEIDDNTQEFPIECLKYLIEIKRREHIDILIKNEKEGYINVFKE